MKAPDWLDPMAEREFSRVYKELGRDKIKEVDLSLLADYAQAYADCVGLKERIFGKHGNHTKQRTQGEGLTLEGPKGGEYLNPVYVALMNRRDNLAQLRRDLYFTPKSRSEKKPLSKSKGRSLMDKIDNDTADEENS